MDILEEKEAFEAWVGSNGRSIERFSDGSYKSMTLDKEWEAWQAAKAQAVPEGYVLMPIKPTETMVMAVVKEHEGDAFLPYSLYDAYVKQAMIEAQEPAND